MLERLLRSGSRLELEDQVLDLGVGKVWVIRRDREEPSGVGSR
jgi:hypothetical protein